MAKIKKAQAGISAPPKKMPSAVVPAAPKAGPTGSTFKKSKSTDGMKPTKLKMKAGGSISKAQKGKTVMQNLSSKYPGIDTSAAGDTRFEEYNAYAPKKALKKISDTDKAFNQKYGKGKPAKQKMKMGGSMKSKKC